MSENRAQEKPLKISVREELLVHENAVAAWSSGPSHMTPVLCEDLAAPRLFVIQAGGFLEK